MLSKVEFEKLNKNNLLNQLNCDTFILSKETNSFLLEKKEISFRSKPEFVMGCTNELPKIEQIFKNLEAHSSEKRLCSLSNVALIGCNMVKNIVTGEFIHLSGIKSEDYLIKNYPVNHSGYHLSFHHDGTRNIYYKNGNGLKINGVGLIIHGYEADNYGSFIFRCLPQLLLAKELDLDFDYLILPKRTQWAMQAIALLNFGIKPVLAHDEVQGIELDECKFIQTFDNQGFLSSFDTRRIINFCESIWQKAPPHESYEKIYVSRRWVPSRTIFTRNLTSEASIMEHLEPLGFKEVHSQLLSFKEQINVFMRAKLIIGTSGSGLLNSMFSPPKTKVLEMESTLACTTQHANIYSSTAKSFSFFLGKTEQKTPDSLHPWSIDLVDFKHAVEHFQSY
ncbi:glycosyltransferase family 61 protein [Aeromonas veronii]|uniref:glycosyltransferase family 61 protein n=1 Tax=Aeromonas veronii TaxID=654 RepID=UPI00191FDCEF|nr:glycosyltransferase 61 family protein [Aeromonas veronii]MBL0616514.1 DUF563 domain-containing protein [Aeromonas veronii]